MGNANAEKERKRLACQDNAGSCLSKEVEARSCSRHLALGPHRPTREIDVRLQRAVARELTPNQQRQRNSVHPVRRLSADAKEAPRLLDSMATDDCSCFGPSERVSEFHIQRLNDRPAVPVRLALAFRRENF